MGGEGNAGVFSVQSPGSNIWEMTPKRTQMPHLPSWRGDGGVTAKLWVRWTLFAGLGMGETLEDEAPRYWEGDQPQIG